MQIIADTHTHTLVSGHAYSTLAENFAHAAKIGLRFLCTTEHTNRMPGAPHLFYFENLHELPDELFGVYLIRGCEANVENAQGGLDIPEGSLANLEWVIASMHPPVYPPEDTEAHTNAWLQIAQNPHVDVIGHCGDGRYRFDYETVVQAFAENGKIVEINAHSFQVRQGSPENCREIARLCRKYGVRVVVSSDAHFYASIAEFSDAVEMLEEIGFPEELVMNADYGRFAALLSEKCGREFPPIGQR